MAKRTINSSARMITLSNRRAHTPGPTVTREEGERSAPCHYFLLFLRNSDRIFGPDNSFGRSLFPSQRAWKRSLRLIPDLVNEAFQADAITSCVIQFRQEDSNTVFVGCVPLTDEEYTNDFKGKAFLQDVGQRSFPIPEVP